MNINFKKRLEGTTAHSLAAESQGSRTIKNLSNYPKSIPLASS
jgi:hypothetical protein